MLIRLLIFGILNFGGLAIGALFTNPGVASEWYQAMNKAPWTPPGWVFGAAWTIIMICFTLYLALLWDKLEDKSQMIYLYISSLILNVAWNYVFFSLHQMGTGLIVISALLGLVLLFLFRYWSTLKTQSLLIVPYAVWMCIATSLNAYGWAMN